MKNWLITGGTSGLGLSLARELKKRGERVAVVARNRDRLESICQAEGFIAVSGDVSDKAQVYSILAQATAALGRIDVLVNNASSLGVERLKLLADTDCEELEAALATNVVGPFRLTKAVLGQMALRRQGLVINISSDAAANAYATWGAYGASKAALDHLTRIWAEETREDGITWYTVDPGDMDTPLHEQAVPGSLAESLKTPEVAATQLLAWLDQNPRSGERKSL